MKLVATALAGWLLLATPSAAKAQGPQPQPRVLELKTSDGTLLKATYFAAICAASAKAAAPAGRSSPTLN